MISVIDVSTKEEYAKFEGAQTTNTIGTLNICNEIKNEIFFFFIHQGNSWTHVKEISNTKLVVSQHHRWNTSAKMEIFDLSKKGRAMKIRSFEEIRGRNY